MSLSPSEKSIERQTSLQWGVFNIWFLSLSIIIISLFSAGTGSSALDYKTEPGELIRSATLLLGLITPVLGTIITFYIRQNPNSRDKRINGVSLELFRATIMFSLFYHILLSFLVIRGVIFLNLVDVVGRDALYRQCVFVVNLMGLLSVLLLPTIWLFGGEPVANAQEGSENPRNGDNQSDKSETKNSKDTN